LFAPCITTVTPDKLLAYVALFAKRLTVTLIERPTEVEPTGAATGTDAPALVAKLDTMLAVRLSGTSGTAIYTCPESAVPGAMDEDVIAYVIVEIPASVVLAVIIVPFVTFRLAEFAAPTTVTREFGVGMLPDKIRKVTVAVVVTAESEIILPRVGPVLSLSDPYTNSGVP
jgi:hypothetical protein